MERRIILMICLLSFLFTSCKKEKADAAVFSEARYSIEVTGKWSLPDFTVPAGVHFTNFIGMVHNQKSFLWQEGKLASVGVENVAETGSISVLLLEIDTMIEKNTALSLVLFSPPGPTATKKATISSNSNYSYLSLVSMIAPSPDWMVGITSLNLYRNQGWVNDTTLNLFVYDAGTEDGDVFGYNNPATVPRQNIIKLEVAKATVLSNGNPFLKPIATVRLVKL